MENRNYYDVLGVDRNASPEEIKKAYRRLAIENHPDRNPGNQEAVKRLREVLKAYDVLGNAEKRARYDQAAAPKPVDSGIVVARKEPAKAAPVPAEDTPTRKRPARKRKPAGFADRLKKRLWLLWLNAKSLFGKKKKRAQAKRKEKKVPLKKKILVIVLNLLGMAAVLALVPYLTLVWVDSYAKHGEIREVPSLCDGVTLLTLDEAAAVLREHGLGYEIIEYKYKEGADKDVVIMQYPEAGAEVKEGRKIGLVINSGVKPKRTIPSVIDNRTYREAESHIKAAGFVIERVDSINGERDWVYELRYNDVPLVNGEAIPQGSKVVVVVGNGKPLLEEEEPIFEPDFDI